MPSLLSSGHITYCPATRGPRQLPLSVLDQCMPLSASMVHVLNVRRQVLINSKRQCHPKQLLQPHRLWCILC